VIPGDTGVDEILKLPLDLVRLVPRGDLRQRGSAWRLPTTDPRSRSMPVDSYAFEPARLLGEHAMNENVTDLLSHEVSCILPS
jgi:hypothetical protein